MNMFSVEFFMLEFFFFFDSDFIGGIVFMKVLVDENVEFIWGYFGGLVFYIYDELYKQDKIQYVLVCYEQVVVYVVDVYVCFIGNVGVCFVMLGFGVINVVIGIVMVYMDLILMVVISG